MREQSGPSSLRIAIADDENTIRQGLHFIIRQKYPAIELLEATNGLECWELLHTAEPFIQLAFIDIRMPGMDGIEVCERVHAERLPTRMVIISGFRDFEYARQGLRSGIVDYLLKPVNPSDVIHHVNELAQHMAGITPSDGLNEKQERLVIELVRKWIHDHLHKELTLSDLSEKFHYSPSYLSALFKKEAGTGFSEYLTDCRMQRAKHLLLDPSLRISDIAVQVGYTNARAFSIAFRKACTITPTEYREKRGIEMD